MSEFWLPLRRTFVLAFWLIATCCTLLARPVVAQAPPAEIVELARALKNDPDLIFEYVYNNIETLPQFGSLKGATGALIDGMGTAHDQTELMVALLRQSGYSAGVVTGNVVLGVSYLTAWLGTDTAYGSVAVTLSTGGFSGSIATVDGTVNTPVTSATINWAWVYVDIAGTRYVFDPSSKSYDRSAGLGGPAIAAALGYVRATFLAGAEAPATITPISITGLDRPYIRRTLAGYATKFVQYLRATNPAASTKDIIGGKTIVPWPVGLSVRQTSLSYQSGPATAYSSMPSSLRTTIQFELGSNDPATGAFTSLASPVLFNSSDLYGRRTVVSFNASAIPALLVEGVAQVTASGTVPAGRQLTVRTSIIHPYGGSFANELNSDVIRVAPAANALSVIGMGWGRTGRGMIEKHRGLLLQNRALDPDNPAAEPVLGESLAMLGYTWLAELSQQMVMLDELAGMTIFYHHAVGVIGTKTVGSSTGPFVDLPINLTGTVQRASRPPPPPPPTPTPPTPTERAAFVTLTTFASVAESGTLEQTQPGAVAVSTTKLIDIAVQSGGQIFDINNSATGGSPAQYTATIRPVIAGTYLAGDLARIDGSVYGSTNLRVIAPANGSIIVDQYTGAGYYALSQDGSQFSAYITGGLSGGEPATPVSDAAIVFNTPIAVTPGPGQSPTAAAPISSFGNYGGNLGVTPVGNDPINLVTGDYLLSASDLAVGSQGLPYGLVFQRYYDSGTRFRSGPLGPAWTHNFIITALPNSDAFEGLGVTSPINGASAVAALFVVFDLLNAEASTSKSLKSIVIASVAQRWLMDELTNNVVAVTQPGFVEHFLKLADGTYNPPFASGARLTLDNGAYTYVGKDRTTLSFDADGNLATWRNAAGATLTLAYTGSPAKLASVTNDFRRQLTFTYTADLLTQVQDDSGRSTSYLYDSSSNLVGAVDPLGNQTSYAYDVPGRMTTIIQPSFPGTPFVTNRYDTLDRVMTQSYGDGGTWQYFFAGARSEEVDPYGMRRVLYNTPRGKTRLEVQDYGGLNLVTTTTFDGVDRPTETTFPEGNKLAYTYDGNSNILTTSAKAKPGVPALPDLVTSYVYDPTFNKPVQVTDPRGLVTTMAYDAGGNLASTVADSTGLRARTTYTWTGAGLPLSVTDPVGKVTRHTYDEFANRLSTIEGDGAGPLSRTTAYAYNAWGDVVSVTDPNGNVTSAIFDLARRPVTTTTPATAAAPGGMTTANTYDADGRLVQVQQSSGGTLLRTSSATWTPTGKQATATDANGNVTVNAYDLLDRLVRTTDAEGRVTTYTFDAVSRPLGVFNPAIQAAALLSQTWTANGQRASLTGAAAGHTTTFTYDRYDRLFTTTYPGGSTEQLTYDANGNVLTRKTRAGSTIAFTYDGLNRLATKTPPSSPVVTYSYDLAGRMIGVTDTSAAIVAAVSPTGSTVTYASTFTYNALNQPTNAVWDPAPVVTSPVAGPLVTFGHSYDRTNRRIGQTVDDNTWLAYPAGAPSTTSYTANTLNQYTAVTGLTPSYDGNGNLTGDGTYTYGYDAENRLVSATGAGNTASYAYDGRGQRKSRTVNGTTTISVTDSDNREVLEYDGSTGAILRWYAYSLGPNDVLNQMNVPGGTRSVFLPDLQGSVIATYSSAGALAKSAYQPYGGSAAPASPFAFTGQRIEPETGGLYYYRARNYSSVFGRFLQVDPVGYSVGPNLYAYVVNDPLNLVDPLGLVPSSSSIGQNLAQGTLNLVPGAYYSGLTQQQFQQGNYWTAAGYGVASLLDAGLGVATLGLSTRLGATIRAAEEPILRFAQTTASAFFSSEGNFAGRSIASVASDLRAGVLTASDVPVQYLVRDGTSLIINTRSSLALRQANLPISQWNLVNQTGVGTAESSIIARLLQNRLGSEGTDVLRITGAGKGASLIKP